jgi:hypothetical protein
MYVYMLQVVLGIILFKKNFIFKQKQNVMYEYVLKYFLVLFDCKIIFFERLKKSYVRIRFTFVFGIIV